jgi:hypothetical protein
MKKPRIKYSPFKHIKAVISGSWLKSLVIYLLDNICMYNTVMAAEIWCGSEKIKLGDFSTFPGEKSPLALLFFYGFSTHWPLETHLFLPHADLTTFWMYSQQKCLLSVFPAAFSILPPLHLLCHQHLSGPILYFFPELSLLPTSVYPSLYYSHL